jgi:hypothetical protein
MRESPRPCPRRSPTARRRAWIESAPIRRGSPRPCLKPSGIPSAALPLFRACLKPLILGSKPFEFGLQVFLGSHLRPPTQKWPKNTGRAEFQPSKVEEGRPRRDAVGASCSCACDQVDISGCFRETRPERRPRSSNDESDPARPASILNLGDFPEPSSWGQTLLPASK